MAAHHGINFDQFKDHPHASDIEWVPTHEVDRFRDPNAVYGPGMDPKYREHEEPYQANLTSKIAREGVQTPLQLQYYTHTNKAILGEGHHRLEAAKRLGIEHLPVRGLRYNSAGGVTPVSGWQGGGHVPGELAPSKFGVKTTKRGE